MLANDIFGTYFHSNSVDLIVTGAPLPNQKTKLTLMRTETGNRDCYCISVILHFSYTPTFEK